MSARIPMSPAMAAFHADRDTENEAARRVADHEATRRANDPAYAARLVAYATRDAR